MPTIQGPITIRKGKQLPEGILTQVKIPFEATGFQCTKNQHLIPEHMTKPTIIPIIPAAIMDKAVKAAEEQTEEAQITPIENIGYKKNIGNYEIHEVNAKEATTEDIPFNQSCQIPEEPKKVTVKRKSNFQKKATTK